MYRTALDHFGVFDSLHAVGPTKLLGDDSVWYSDQFDVWNVTAAFHDGKILRISTLERAFLCDPTPNVSLGKIQGGLVLLAERQLLSTLIGTVRRVELATLCLWWAVEGLHASRPRTPRPMPVYSSIFSCCVES